MRLRMLLLLVGICLTAMLLSTQDIHAQSPRISLIEEATNASCGPCASQNPTFQAYLMREENRGKFAPVIWHAWWPGRDVMWSANTDMNRERIEYYEVSGVPTAIVNGVDQMPPSSTSNIASSIAGAAGMSPVTIDITQTRTGDQIDVSVDVATTEDLTGYRMYIVAAEGFHYYDDAGSNGEKEFHYIARQLLPNNQAIQLTLGAGESDTFSGSYTVDPEWNTNEMYTTVYIQEHNTRQVIQAATNLQYLDIPEQADNAAMTMTPGDGYTFTMDFTPDVGGEYQFNTIERMPEGWTTTIQVNDTYVAAGEFIDITSGTTVQLKTTITPTTESLRRDGRVALHISGPFGASAFQEYTLLNAPIEVLTIAKDDEHGVMDQYAESFDLSDTWTYAFIRNGEESIVDVKDYDILVVETGAGMLLNANDVAMIRDYMDDGGKIMIAGAYAAFGLGDPSAVQYGAANDVDLLENTFGVRFVSRDADASSTDHDVRGISGDLLWDRLAVSISGRSSYPQYYPDVLEPVNGAVAMCYYDKDESKYAGIRYTDGTNSTVFYGFGLEGIDNRTRRRDILKRSIEWLQGATPIEPTPLANGIGIGVYPNPARGVVTIPVTMPATADARIAIYNAIGEEVATVHNGTVSDAASFAFDSGTLAPGVYSIRIEANGSASSTLFSVIR